MSNRIKKKRITYGVMGMMEFETVITVGQTPMRILFTGGSINALGTHPAKFMTDSLMLQHSIERSAQFKSGLIKRLRVVELEDEIEIGRNEGTPEDRQTPTTKDSEQSNEGTPEDRQTPTTKGYERSNEEAPTDSPREGNNEPIRVEFEVNEDAKDYLEQNFGVIKSKLINRAAIIEAGKQNGVDIIFV